MTQDELKELLHYEPTTGKFTWLVSTSNRVSIGSEAGKAGVKATYRQIRIDGVAHLSHRLAFLYMTGTIPDIVDHVNGVKHDNTWVNLREADTNLNQHNRQGANKNSTSGIRGVSLHKPTNKWYVEVWANSNKHYLGLYEDLELAELVAEEARSLLHKETL